MRATQQNVKKTSNGNLFVEVVSRRQAEIILKIKSFHATKCNVYPDDRFNASKEVVRSWKLTLISTEEMTVVLREQGVKNIFKNHN